MLKYWKRKSVFSVLFNVSAIVLFMSFCVVACDEEREPTLQPFDEELSRYSGIGGLPPGSIPSGATGGEVDAGETEDDVLDAGEEEENLRDTGDVEGDTPDIGEGEGDAGEGDTPAPPEDLGSD
jgi:hypothetical protein